MNHNKKARQNQNKPPQNPNLLKNHHNQKSPHKLIKHPKRNTKLKTRNN